MTVTYRFRRNEGELLTVTQFSVTGRIFKDGVLTDVSVQRSLSPLALTNLMLDLIDNGWICER